jgi:transcriptional regulator with XRE-family HTH domain
LAEAFNPGVAKPTTIAPIRQLLARNLRGERARIGIGQEAFALKIGLSRNYMSSLERGKQAASIDIIQKLADGFDIPPWRLLFDEEIVGEERDQDG